VYGAWQIERRIFEALRDHPECLFVAVLGASNVSVRSPAS
jgi:hypothetical protein